MQNRRTTRWAALLAAAAVATVSAPAGAQPASAPRPAHQPRCDGAGDVRPGTTAVRTVASGDRLRSYRIHVPQGSDGRTPLPVVVAYHGRGQHRGRAPGVLRPLGSPRHRRLPRGVVGTGGGERQAWQGAPYARRASTTWPSPGPARRHRAARVRRPRPIYATGKSNGAGLVNLLACRLPDRLAAIAPVAAAVYPRRERRM
ncbi:hypothetical protein [Tsukamurella tyrosinosolvens]|uniref:hypothetical protein n=1 Tax=Tsukamurella tyrosinosolvens TaxID=57704 RepID=UPI000A6D9165|nr:hypothetical protein [Tsukamurella tyrosinosolvens]